MDTPDTSAGFADLGLSPAVTQAVGDLGYESPTPVQSQCIPHLLAGRDLLGQAQTGTGKTAAFALPLLSRIDLEVKAPQILVLAPTRELALQVAEAFQEYAAHLPGFLVLPIYGGQSYGLQISQLKRRPQVIVGTPGRVMDHIRRGTLSLAGIRALVLDEADEMLNMGFAEDIDWIFDQAPEERQVALFSATMPRAIRQVAEKRLRDPMLVQVAADSETVDTIDQHHCVVTRFHKLDVLTRILEIEEFDGMVVFVRTKHGTTELADKLKAHGFAAEALNGDMNQEMRERTIDRLKQGQLDILVATDVAARGLDVERISHVVNFDIPTDPSAYVHRIGRTGRAGRAGRALLLVEPRERGLLRAIERTIRRSVPAMEPPSAADLSESRIDRFTAEIKEALGQDLDFFYRLLSRLNTELEVEMHDLAAALAYLNQRERPLEIQEELPRPRPSRERHDRGPRHERGGRPERGDRGERRPRRERDHDAGRPLQGDLEHYRIEVGHQHGATPREIVGAIANEAGLEGRFIGRIDIQDDHSVVDLPKGMPREVFQHLKRVYVRGQALRISALDQGEGEPRRGGGAAPVREGRPGKPRPGKFVPGRQRGDRTQVRRGAPGEKEWRPRPNRKPRD
ncbi:RNA helicase [Marichromatium purpuratum 984]|uniref:ATP-dependent RNA helicase DeaD n=1 Tax=Marichromatium purpuratum 984 TaxID=765910 RepID=W0E858_MARPU|nr:DEAD/DEAH box helicase [Marichromatium purpuratum]AHF05231.1 RNA helicase [Marichromatium purpuratum 984]